VKIKAEFMQPVVAAMYEDSPKAGEIIEVLDAGAVVFLAGATGERAMEFDDNAVQFISERYEGGITISSRTAFAEYWRRPGEDKWKI